MRYSATTITATLPLFLTPARDFRRRTHWRRRPSNGGGSVNGKWRVFEWIEANASAHLIETALCITLRQRNGTDERIRALIDKTTPAEQYRATRRYLGDPRDTGTPNGTVQLLARVFGGKALSKSSTALLVEILKATTTFPTRLKGLLPTGTVVAHKTGSTGTVNGLTAATNDSGVIFLPNSGMLAVSVYVKASTRDNAARDSIIARIARAAFDYHLQQPSA
jgi:beta-lactamase class A